MTSPNFRSELKQDIAELRSELKQDIAELRSELKQDIVGLKADLYKHMWLMQGANHPCHRRNLETPALIATAPLRELVRAKPPRTRIIQ